MRRKLGRKEAKRRNKKIILSSILLLFLLSVGYGAFQSIISINATGHIKFDERCAVGNVFNFEQNDEIQEFKVPCSGTYKLETWGASGGDALTLEGGYGGYSVGNIDLRVKQNIYVVVGGKGESTLELENKGENYCISLNGGYNGGGSGASGQCDRLRFGASGGGATHIAKTRDFLTSLSNNLSDLYIVSGGGGGAFTFENITTYGAYGPGHQPVVKLVILHILL